MKDSALNYIQPLSKQPAHVSPSPPFQVLAEPPTIVFCISQFRVNRDRALETTNRINSLMSLTTVYQSFLAAPSANFLATDDASLNYITTLTTIKGVAAITKHLSQQQSLLRKKEEKVISAIEGGNAISLDVETTVEFIRGGGAYLPGIDDNFLVDHVATLPIVSTRPAN